MYGYLNPELATAESGPIGIATERPTVVPHRRTVRVARGLVMGALALFLSLLIVAADHAMGRWGQAGTAVSVLMLWLIVFACLALLARMTGRIALRLALAVSRWRTRRSTVLTDQQMMAMALRDPRVRADVDAALHANADSGSQKYFAPGYCRYL
jgi:hypothetical protein